MVSIRGYPPAHVRHRLTAIACRWVDHAVDRYLAVSYSVRFCGTAREQRQRTTKIDFALRLIPWHEPIGERLHETHQLILFVVRESESCQEFGVHVICRLTEASTSDPNRIQPRSGVMLRFLNDADAHVTAVATEWRRH